MPRKLPSRQTHAALPATEADTPARTYSAINSAYNYTSFPTTDRVSYLSFLGSLDLASLQNHAIEVGSVIPDDNKDRLVTRLLEEFDRAARKMARR